MSSLHSEASPPVLRKEQSLRETAEDLLSLAACVIREGWSDKVATHLRQAAHDLLDLAHSEEPAG